MPSGTAGARAVVRGPRTFGQEVAGSVLIFFYHYATPNIAYGSLFGPNRDQCAKKHWYDNTLNLALKRMSMADSG